MKRNVLFAAILTAAILLFSCVEDDDQTGDVDFTSNNTNFSILVRNNTGERLVAFKGDLLESKLIGGVPAHAQNHGLPYDPALFDKTEDFPMILITEGQYNANKANLSSLKNTPFTRVYVFFNKSGDNTVVYEIANGLGGNNTLEIVQNSTTVNVELRVGGVAGETLGYAPAGMLTTSLKLQDGDFDIFPVFKRYNTFRDVVETVYPKNAQGNPWFQSHNFSNKNTISINLKKELENLNFTLGAAWVVVNNQTTSGGIRFYEGTVMRTTASGYYLINNGSPVYFQIDMPKVTGTSSYAPSIVVANWSFGAPSENVPLQTGETDTTPLSSLTIEQGKMYTITVSGDHNAASGIKAWISEETTIQSSELIGNSW